MISHDLLAKDAKALHDLWTGNKDGSGIGTTRQQVLRLISVHEDKDRRALIRMIGTRFDEDWRRPYPEVRNAAKVEFLRLAREDWNNEKLADADYQAMRRIEDTWV